MWIPKYPLIDWFYTVCNLQKICDTIAALGKKELRPLFFCDMYWQETIYSGLLTSSIYLAYSLHVPEEENGYEVGTVRVGSDVHKIN